MLPRQNHRDSNQTHFTVDLDTHWHRRRPQSFEMKELMARELREADFEVTNFGDCQLKSGDDYPDLWPASAWLLPSPGYWVDEQVAS